MEILKAYTFKLEPTPEQAGMLDRWVGNARFVWNKMLAMNLYRLDNRYHIMRYAEMCKLLTLWRQSDRQTQAHFECVACEFVENADVVGAINIRSRGLRAVMPVEAAA